MANFRQRTTNKNEPGVFGKSYRSFGDENSHNTMFPNRPKQQTQIGLGLKLGNEKRTVLGTLSSNVDLKRDSIFSKPKTGKESSKPSFLIYEDLDATAETTCLPSPSPEPQEAVTRTDTCQLDVYPDSPMTIDKSLDEPLNKSKSEPTELSTYAQEIYQYMKQLERKIRPKAHYMRKQPDITHGMRSILVDWLVEVAEEYKLHAETLYLSICYIDRFLSTMSVLRSKLQLVGTASMFIASKYEEIYPPDVSEFVYITDDTYSKKQVLRMEHLVLKVLSFDLAIPTAHYFLKCFCSWTSVSTEVEYLAKYLCELTLLHADPFLRFLPSEVACSALALAHHTLDLESWNSDLALYTGYDFNDFCECFKCLHATFCHAPAFPQQAIREKYSSARYHSVALYMPPPLSNC